MTPPDRAGPNGRHRRLYDDGIDSCLRTIMRAEPEHRRLVFAQMTRAAIDFGRVGGFDLSDITDRLHAAAVDSGLVDDIGVDAVTAILAAGMTPQPEPQPVQRAPTYSSGNGQRRQASDAELVARRAAGIAPERIDWLWVGRLARGKHTCAAGEPGTGKSQVSVAIAATVTTGGEWPCNEGRAPIGSVIILSAEDGAADTIVPRLIAAGPDLSRVHLVSAVRELEGNGRRSFSLQSDIASLERKIAEIGDVALVIIDPVSSYLGRADSHENADVRGVLEPLGEMSERNRVAVLTITHFSKVGANTTTKALHRFIGSIAFTGAPRAAFAVVDDAEKEGRRLFLGAKNNLAPPPQGLAYRLEQTIVADGIVASRVVWDRDPVTITANEAMAAEATGGEARSAKARPRTSCAISWPVARCRQPRSTAWRGTTG